MEQEMEKGGEAQNSISTKNIFQNEGENKDLFTHTKAERIQQQQPALQEILKHILLAEGK